ncbi:xyloglucan endotransglucosylase/hydrolase protein 3-like [Prosopis cineraria]|uniref:xyloglucan endotransglucosylase/hydrolase protein 3-like n=1 Tax=Prosopis cineraria TaxID=364024 RepID=UPI00240F8794|nr:xyloglucan endotransglucosylase/hydrolase protein 3-like [Prosopis cineraria]
MKIKMPQNDSTESSPPFMWFVDGMPVRAFRNNGGSFPMRALSIIGTIWNGSWASIGAPVNWNDGPLLASYRGFGITACPTQSPNDPQCNDSSKH